MRNQTLQRGNVAPFCTGNTLPSVAPCTTAPTAPSPPSPRLTRQLYLCPTCEGLLLAAVVGLPLPMVCDGDGELEAAIGGFLLRLLVTRAAGCALD